MRRFAIGLAATMLLQASAGVAADVASCRDMPCRANELAYVTDSGGVTIMPGEAFSIELTFEGSAARAVPKATGKATGESIDLKFDRAGQSLMLSLKNNSERRIKMDMFMKLADGRFVPTSSCPVLARLSLFEVWSDRIEHLELRNFRALSDKDTVSCS
jgi:hypothetical protein